MTHEENIDVLDFYISLHEKHIPDTKYCILAPEMFKNIKKLPDAIKILQDHGFSKEEAEKNSFFSIYESLKDQH